MGIRHYSAALAVAAAGCMAPHAVAGAQDERGQWTLITSNLVSHYRSNPDHNNHPGMIGLEYRRPGSGWLVGGITFSNSFSQRSHYAFVGRRFEARNLPVYAKVTGGLIQGYRGEFRDRIPFNRLGVAPAVVPTVGIQVDRFSTEVAVLGNSALALMVNFDF